MVKRFLFWSSMVVFVLALVICVLGCTPLSKYNMMSFLQLIWAGINFVGNLGHVHWVWNAPFTFSGSRWSILKCLSFPMYWIVLWPFPLRFVEIMSMQCIISFFTWFLYMILFVCFASVTNPHVSIQTMKTSREVYDLPTTTKPYQTNSIEAYVDLSDIGSYYNVYMFSIPRTSLNFFFLMNLFICET